MQLFFVPNFCGKITRAVSPFPPDRSYTESHVRNAFVSSPFPANAQREQQHFVVKHTRVSPPAKPILLILANESILFPKPEKKLLPSLLATLKYIFCAVGDEILSYGLSSVVAWAKKWNQDRGIFFFFCDRHLPKCINFARRRGNDKSFDRIAHPNFPSFVI